MCSLLLSFSMLFVSSSQDPASAAENSPLRGIDLKGQLHWLGEQPGCQGFLVVFLTTDCPISNRYIPVLNEIAGKERSKQALRVYGVISHPHVTRDEAVAHAEKFEPRFPMLFDASGELRERLAPTHTPHAFLLSRGGKVVYDGAIDDRFAAINKQKSTVSSNYLKDAIHSLLQHKKIDIARTKPIGCPMEVLGKPKADAKITYSRDIAPILHAHCSVCHRPGEAGPFPLLTYQDAIKHAHQIQFTTEARIMPPWKPVSGFGRFREEAMLSEHEIAMIADWVKAGLPEGPAADKSSRRSHPTGWQLGEPDLVLEMPQEFSLDASGDDVHQHFVLPTGLTRDRLVEAVEFRPGNPAVVHHAGFYLDVSGAAQKLADAAPDLGYAGGPGPQFYSYGKLRSWVPGMRPDRFPRGHGQLLRKGSDIMMEIHYQRTGKPETDRSRIGIYFAPPSSRQLVSEIQVMDTNLAIPAGENRFHQHVTYQLPTATTLLDVSPHLHYLGREAKAEVHLPNGDIKPLIWIKDWDFNWQGHYVFLEPIRLPADTKIECDFYFDNSADNSRNPHHPPQHVYWGSQSKEEMAVFVFFYTCDNLRDLLRSHQHQIQSYLIERKPDPLPIRSALTIP